MVEINKLTTMCLHTIFYYFWTSVRLRENIRNFSARQCISAHRQQLHSFL